MPGVRVPVAIFVALLASRIEAGEPGRIISLDYCSDQFVLKLVDRERILAVSPDARKSFSFMRDAAEGIRQVRPRAEEVLPLDPDLVVRSYAGGPKMRPFLERAGVPVVEVGFASNLEEGKQVLLDMAAALGEPERGAELVREMEAREAALPERSGEETMLYLTASGYTTGPGSLADEMMRLAGFRNFHEKPGWHPLPLERLAYEKPDQVAAGFADRDPGRMEPWGAGRHPVARKQLRGVPTTPLSGAWTACGSWFLLHAIEALAAAE